MVALRSRQSRAALLAVPTAVAALLVLWGIGHEPLWRDEAASATIAGRPIGSMWHVIVHHEANMALYDVLLHVWTWFGHGEAFLRLPSAACAVATVPVAMLVARRIAGDAAAAVTGVVLALNGFLMTYGQQVRGYALTMLLAAGAALALLKALERGRTRDWVVWALLVAALPWAHMLGALIVVAQVASLVFYPRAKLPLRSVALALGGAVLAWVPLLAFTAAGDHDRTDWVAPLGRDLVRHSVENWAGTLGFGLLLGACGVVVLVALVAALRHAGGRSEEAWRLALPLCWVSIPPVLLAVICAKQQMWVDRYLIGFVPALAVLAGVAVVCLARALAPVAGAALALLLLAGALHAATKAEHPPSVGEDLRGAAELVAARTQPGDAMVFTPAFSRIGLRYYLDRQAREPFDLALAPGQDPVARGDLFAGELPPAEIARRLRGARRVWLLGYGFESDWKPTPEPVIAVAPTILREDFRPAGRWAFAGNVVRLYVRR